MHGYSYSTFVYDVRSREFECQAGQFESSQVYDHWSARVEYVYWSARVRVRVLEVVSGPDRFREEGKNGLEDRVGVTRICGM